MILSFFLSFWPTFFFHPLFFFFLSTISLCPYICFNIKFISKDFLESHIYKEFAAASQIFVDCLFFTQIIILKTLVDLWRPLQAFVDELFYKASFCRSNWQWKCIICDKLFNKTLFCRSKWQLKCIICDYLWLFVHNKAKWKFAPQPFFDHFSSHKTNYSTNICDYLWLYVTVFILSCHFSFFNLFSSHKINYT